MARIVITILILITTLVLVLFGAGSYLEQRKKLSLELNEELEAVSSQIASSMALPLWNIDPQQVDEIVKSIMQNRRVYGIRICEEDENTCNTWLRNEDWYVIRSTDDIQNPGFPKKAMEIKFDGITLGTFEVVLTPEFANQELYSYLVRTGVNILILNALLVAILALVLQKIVLKPLKILERYAVGVQAGGNQTGDFGTEQFIGELGTLANSFENMTKKLERRIELETLIADISQRFIEASPQETDDAVDWALKAVGLFLKVDRSYIYRWVDDDSAMFITNEWCGQAVESQIDRLRNIPMTAQDWPVRDMPNGETVSYSSLEDLSPETAKEVIAWRTQEVQSILCSAMGHAQSLRGFVGLDSVKEKCSWSEEDIQLIRLVGEIITNTLERQRAEKELAAMNVHLEELVDERTRELAQKAQDLAMAMEQAQEANKTKNEFLARMSHEIRTPMNAIIGLTNLVLKTSLDTIQKDYLVKVQDSSRHLLSIINDILDFSKIEASKLELDKQDFMLNHVIDHVADMFAERSADKHLELFYILDRRTPVSVRGDSLRLGQILINLISNALKFTDQGSIIVRVKPAEEPARDGRVNLIFSVSDTGIGIPQEKIETLFQPFTQIDGSTTRKYGGTGLGLSICQRLVELMDGRIWIESQVGQGSTFFFTVSLDVPEKAEIYNLTLPQDLRGLKTLVVDDNETACLILKEILQSFEFEVSTAFSAQEGLDRLKSDGTIQPFDLVILDWMMPGMDGFEFAQKIYDRSLLIGIKRPKTIMVSMYGRDDIFEEKRKKKSEIDGFLLKPINSSELFNCIMKLFGQEEAIIKRRVKKKRVFDLKQLETINGARILIAEDNALNQVVAVAMLEMAGFKVECVGNGKKAVSMLKERADASKPKYDALLMDIQMPEMDGFQATRIIRQDPRFQNLPIIAMTAHALKGDRDKCLEAGMNDYVSKPVEEGELYAALLKWVEPGEREISEDEPIGRITAEEPWEGMPTGIPGINLTVGLERVQGNTGLYKKMLRNFMQEFERAAEEIKTCLNEGEIKIAEQMVHSITGISGNIGANDLFLAARDLNDALRLKKTDGVEPLLSLFLQRLSQVMASLKSLDLETAPQTSAGKKVREADLVKIASILREMNGHLKKNSSRVRHGLSPLKEFIGDTSYREQWDRLEKAIYQLDTEKALSIISELADSLHISIKEEMK